MRKFITAFSLIELLVVIAIVAVLAAIAVPTYNNYRIRAETSGATAALSNLADKVAQYQDLNGTYPSAANLYSGAVGNLVTTPSTVFPNLTFLSIQSSALPCGESIGIVQGILNYPAFASGNGLMFQLYILRSNNATQVLCLEGTATAGLINGQDYLGCNKSNLTTTNLTTELQALVCP